MYDLLDKSYRKNCIFTSIKNSNFAITCSNKNIYLLNFY